MRTLFNGKTLLTFESVRLDVVYDFVTARGGNVLPLPLEREERPLEELRELLLTLLVYPADVVLFARPIHAMYLVESAHRVGWRNEVLGSFHKRIVGSLDDACSETLYACGIPPSFKAKSPTLLSLLEDAAKVSAASPQAMTSLSLPDTAVFSDL